MKKIRILLVATAAALCSYPVTAFAQEDDQEEGDDEGDDEADDDEAGEEDEGDDEADDDEAGDDEADEEGEGDDEADEEGEGDDEADEGEVGAEGEGAAEAPESDLAAICKIDPDACPSLDIDKEAARQIREPLYAMQQIFVLRRQRVEFQPFWGFTLNDQFVSHDGPGLGFNYWITNVLAVGLNGSFYRPFNRDSQFNFQTRRAARIGVPLTEYDWGAALNFTYAPVMGKFAGFGDFIFQYDAYVVGGVGALSSRPIPVIDPYNRLFNFGTKLAFNAGLGVHIFFNRWFAATLEVRDYIFNDELENTDVVQGFESDKSTWLDDEKQLTNNVQAQLGLSIFFPFSFEYRLPK
jgi:outer membrane beta-barrel protein